MNYSIISIREFPENLERAVNYFSSKWKVEYNMKYHVTKCSK